MRLIDMERRSFLPAIAAIAILCGAGITPPAAAQKASVTVFAAASMKDALDGIAAKWRDETGNETRISYAASSALAKQIENGAPAEMFISADLDWMNYLQQRNLINPATRANLLGNKLVLVAPADSKAQVTIAPNFPLAKLLGSGRLAMADPASVPAGKYGKAALTKLGVWDSVAGHVAAAENVRACLLLVSRDEAPFGIVYQTDAAADKGVKIVGTFPADSHLPIIYPMALTRDAGPAAAAFAAYMRTPAAGAILTAQGFTLLDKAQ
jgi:molybdate transport system substrate-binding protein